MEKSEIESYVKAGEIAKEIKKFARGLIEPGMKLIDIAEAVDAKILKLGGKFAFPVNLSLNEIAAHYTPASGDETVAEGILKVDIGVAVDGFIADTAFSIDLTEDGEFGEMIRLNEELLKRASESVRVGIEVRDVGEAVQDALEKWNEENAQNKDSEEGGKFVVIKSLSGHALGRDEIHAGLTISNYRNENRTVLDDVAFAVEPFVTTGVGDIYEGEPGGIYILKRNGQVRDRDARKVLEFIRENYKTKPFCARWLKKAGESVSGGWSVTKLRFILGMMVRQGILYEYPMLIEKSKAPVSQVENTFVVTNGEVRCTTGE
ncbi:type II methionyl aminopeptidase [Candidatus Pacearchaeota archaeon]|nr:type II methionyl aminopeptidase [Candidatus Pacearchaeota archaeon]